MKATFRWDGTLILTPESGIEAFALKAWHAKADHEGLFVLIEPIPQVGSNTASQVRAPA